MKLQTKFSLFSALLVCVVVAGITIAFHWTERKRLNREFQEERAVLIKKVEVLSHDAILSSDYLPLIRYLRETKATRPDILWAGVQHSLEFVAHTESQWIGKSPVDPTTLKAAAATELLETQYAQNGQEILEAAFPVKAGETRIGTVRIGFSQQAIREKFNHALERTTQRILQVALLGILIGIAGAIVLAQTMTRRLSRLVSGARAIATGHFDEPIALKGSDEIRELATEFNLMANQLSKLYGQVKEQSDMLAKANLELIKLDGIKKNFFSLMSHELRGPLTTIKGYISMLLQAQGMEEWQKQEREIQIMREETERISKMVNEFMDLSRIEAGTFQIEKRLVQPKILVEFVIVRMKLEAESQKINLTWEIDEAVPNFQGDPERLAQVLTNLIGNSLKFTPEGGAIRLSVKRIPKGRRAEDVEQILFQVKDSGKGIHKEALEKVFDRYVQMDGDERKKGLGLGLAFAKEVIGRHDGKIWAESEGEGRGALFSFVIPIGEVARNSLSQRRSPSAGSLDEESG